MELGLRNRVAIVGGASKGMGFATARALATEGAHVLMIARNRDTLRLAAERIASDGGSVATLPGDVSDAGLPDRAVEDCRSRWGGVHVLVNNAGGPPMGTLLEHDSAAWAGAIETNLMSVVRFSRAVVPIMKEQRWGRIVSITSTIAKEPSAPMVLSGTARAGVGAFTKALAADVASFNVTVNAVLPGGVLTDRMRQLLQTRAEREKRPVNELLAESQSAIPAKRFAAPEEIANVIVFLASDAGAYVNGVSLAVDGALMRGY